MNHPQLSAHIDETDEDALSYMTNLEVSTSRLPSSASAVGGLHTSPRVPPQIESFDNNKVGYRIRFHFRRNPYFQNNIIMKELHVGMRGERTQEVQVKLVDGEVVS